MIDEAIDNLISIMELKLGEIRVNLMKIEDKEILNKFIKDSRSQIENLFLDFDGVSKEKIDRIKDLKNEYLTLLSLYEI
ncbi:hypothetical protein [Vibrio vulnificus]|uniref:hypothetical protein n=1 Tax=Vibrio vulnificus TaxID=672 RepID=UPI00215C36D4|nr:hypothetical protein [Vibrio vulnificus]MCR9500681.1 hypothetical protein [Vibrio vulnificus]